jgi:hypothetical protein
MSFSRVKPDGWAVNEKLTSAQQNQLDIDHTKAVDKTGDAVTGEIGFLGGSSIVMSTGSILKIADGAVMEGQSGSTSVFRSGSFITVNSGCNFVVASTMTISGLLQAVGNASFTGSTFTIGGSTSVTINGATSVNGNAFFSLPVTCFDNLLIDGNSIAGDRKLRVFDAAYLDIEAFSRMRVLSGAFMDVSGTAFFKDGSSTTFESGSTLSLVAGSAMQCHSSLTITPTGTLFCSFGGTTTFANTPVFQSGFTVSSGTANISGTLNVSAATNISGATTFSGTTTFNSVTNFAGATTITGVLNRLRLTPRVVTKRLSLCNCLATQAGAPIPFEYNTTTDAVEIGANTTLAVALDLPDNCTLTSLEYTWTGSGSIEAAIRANASIIGTLSTSTTPGTYTISLSEIVSRSSKAYRFTFKETATNIPTLTSVSVTYTVSEYAEG